MLARRRSIHVGAARLSRRSGKARFPDELIGNYRARLTTHYAALSTSLTLRLSTTLPRRKVLQKKTGMNRIDRAFWSRTDVSASLARLSHAIKKASGTGLELYDARKLRQLAELVRSLERRAYCRVPPQLSVTGSTDGTIFWSLYLDYRPDELRIELFEEERLLPDGDIIICGSSSARWSASDGALPSEEAFSQVCEILEGTGSWRLHYQFGEPAVA